MAKPPDLAVDDECVQLDTVEREPHADDPHERECRERAEVEEDTQGHVKRDLDDARGGVGDEAEEKNPPRQALTPFPEAIQKQACKQRELGQRSRDEKRTSSDHELVHVEQDGDRKTEREQVMHGGEGTRCREPTRELGRVHCADA
eukprot:scaffold3107_cov73-Phaeocystis_antarctica.AAC.5